MSPKTLIAALFLALLSANFTVAWDSDEDDFDDDGVSMYLDNPRVVNQQISCILKRTACDIMGQKIKKHLKEALYNDCRRCNPKDRQTANKVIEFMKKNHPTEFTQIVEMYKV